MQEIYWRKYLWRKRRRGRTSHQITSLMSVKYREKGGIGQKDPQIEAQFLEILNQPMMCPHLGIWASSDTHTIMSDWLGAACKVWFYILAVVNPKMNGQAFSSLCPPLQIPHGDIGVACILGCHTLLHMNEHNLKCMCFQWCLHVNSSKNIYILSFITNYKISDISETFEYVTDLDKEENRGIW